jgi:hypothetical protein
MIENRGDRLDFGDRLLLAAKWFSFNKSRAPGYISFTVTFLAALFSIFSLIL